MEYSYSRLLNHMQIQGSKYNPPAISIGVVLSDNPLTIKIRDSQLTKENLLISDHLLRDYKRKIKIPSTSATGTAGDYTISSIEIPDAEITFTDGLKKDDIVACLATEDRQTYIILCKVVRI